MSAGFSQNHEVPAVIDRRYSRRKPLCAAFCNTLKLGGQLLHILNGVATIPVLFGFWRTTWGNGPSRKQNRRKSSHKCTFIRSTNVKETRPSKSGSRYVNMRHRTPCICAPLRKPTSRRINRSQPTLHADGDKLLSRLWPTV